MDVIFLIQQKSNYLELSALKHEFVSGSVQSTSCLQTRALGTRRSAAVQGSAHPCSVHAAPSTTGRQLCTVVLAGMSQAWLVRA